jgi:predicted membrane channel-forming protein YqfA (hemolysin III family)
MAPPRAQHLTEEPASRGATPSLEPTHPTPLEELVHALTHGLGAVLALGVLALLVARAAASGSDLHVATASIFGLSLVAVYASSTIYHAIPPRHARAKRSRASSITRRSICS